MYKYLALGIIAIAGIMAIPMSLETQDESKVYGYITMALRDGAGQALFEQIIHNDLIANGENYMLAQSFFNGTSGFVVEADRVDALCVTAKSGFAVNETNTAQTFFAQSTLADTFSCETVNFTIANNGGVNTATTGAITFNATASTGNIASSNTITGIGICSDKGATSDNASVLEAFKTGCSTNSGAPPLIAEVNTADVTLSGAETVDITYTMTLE